MTRLGALRQHIDGLLKAAPPDAEVKEGYIHLYAVAEYAALLAMKRGLDPERAAIAGMLHDIHPYATGIRADHAHASAKHAREILTGLELFLPDEIDQICGAIAKHSDKSAVDDPLSEALKDADVLSHCLYDPTVPPTDRDDKRMQALRVELNLPQ